MFVIIQNGLVTDTLRVDPSSIYPPAYANQFISAPDGVGVGWSYASGVFTAPAGPSLSDLKIAKNNQINRWRAEANQTYFTHSGKQIACDQLSRSDIDAVAGSISLTGAFPAGFPGAWKATDNTYVPLATVDAFKSMYSSMTLQGTVNFGKSQALKTALAAATTLEQVNAIVWGA